MATKRDEMHKAWFLIWELYMEQRDWVLLPQNTVSGGGLLKRLCIVSSDIFPPATVTLESTEPNITSWGERLLRGELALGVLTTNHSKPEFISSRDCCRSLCEFITMSAAIYITQGQGFFPYLTHPVLDASKQSQWGCCCQTKQTLFFSQLICPLLSLKSSQPFIVFSLGVL